MTNDLRLIHTQGLDEGIRCAMCTNTMKSDKGCDGGCVVDQKMYEEVLKVIDKALEAQPCIEDYPTCTECEHYDSEKHYCPRFCQVIKDTLAEAQPSEDCVRREQAKKFLYEEIEQLHDDGLYDCFSRIIDDMYNELPSVTPQRPKGKWIVKEETSYSATLECSVCHRRVTFFGGILRATNERVLEEYPYCHCGADMSGGGEGETDN